VGGLYLCDNTLGTGSGTIVENGSWTEPIREHNRLVAEDERFVSFIDPTREGVLVALRIG
jgi:hypothetical protein